MPPAKSVSPLMQKYGSKLKAASEAAATKPVQYNRVGLPAGITNGVAKLTKCGFGQVAAGKQNAGHYYFRAEGVVVEPASVIVDGHEVPVQGLHTSIMEMLCETKNADGKVTTFEEHVERISNELKKIDPDLDTSDLEAAAAAVNQAAQEEEVYFRFSTSMGKKAPPPGVQPKVFENWNGRKGLESYQPPVADGVEDDTDEAPAKAKASPTPNGKHARKTPPRAEEPEPERETPEQPFDEFGDLDSLLAAAKDGDEDAQVRLKDAAVSQGFTEDEVAEAPDWETVAKMAAGEVKAEGEGDEAAEEPEKESVWTYRPVDPKTKKKGKAVECEVTAVDRKSRTVTLRNLDNPKAGPYLKVSWDDLEST